MSTVNNPFPYFPDAGTNGYIYIGSANQDAQTNPITVYRDEALTIPWAQPIRTLNGYPAYQGSPSGIYLSSIEYSITVQDSRQVTIFNLTSTSDPVAQLSADMTRFSEIINRTTNGADPNYRIGLKYGSLDTTLIGALMFDGTSGFVNKIGINNTKPTDDPPAKPRATDTGYVAGSANYSAIMGGYDNIANGLASIVASMHGFVYSAADHGTIIGGSLHSIEEGSYCGIFAGSDNRITALRNDGVTASVGSNSYIFGGRGGRVTNANSVLFGGDNNLVDGQYAVVLNGNSNKAMGNFDHVAGSNNESRAGTLGAGQKNTIGGGRFNIIDSVTSPTGNTISGGENHEVYGVLNAVGGGDNNTIGTAGVNSTYAAIAGGLDNIVTAVTAGAVLGGRSNSVSGDYAACIGGRANAVSGTYAAGGGQEGAARHAYGFTMGAGMFAAVGDAQSSIVARKATTTNATPTDMTTIVLPNDSTVAFSILVVARRTDADNESAGYRIDGVIDRNANAASTAIVGTVTVTVLGEDTAAWDVTAVANTSSGGIGIRVTGEAGKTIRWVATATLSEVTG